MSAQSQLQTNWNQNHVSRHLSLFGNTTRIRAGESPVDRKGQIETLERCNVLISDTEAEIDEVNKQLKDRNSFYHLFNKIQEGRNKLRQLHSNRDRLIRFWNRQLEMMKINSL